MLDYFCYILQFQTILAGPVVFYNDYRDYIRGINFEKVSHEYLVVSVVRDPR
jgi:MBOAT family.